jgi:GNAT superfamily N-acetyltransferase
MRIELINTVSPELREVVLRELRTYNRAANPDFYAARELPENAAQPLELIAFDEQRQPRGGLFGETALLWLKVNILTVHSAWRKRGIGTQLMREAERIAVACGCRHAYLDTMEYQAPAFYEQLGYIVAGRLPNWDSHGHAKILMTKTL